MPLTYKKNLCAYVRSFATPERQERMRSILAERTDYVTVVLEDVALGHNVSAVIRSAECFGVQTVHIIEGRHPYKNDVGVARGACEWLTLHKYGVAAKRRQPTESTKECFEKLRAQGYAIVATSPHKKAFPLHKLALDKPIALVFGTEQQGLSDYALENADMYVSIPMAGFTESFNISVSAALCLYDVMLRLKESDIQWQLPEERMLDVELDWLRYSVRGARGLEEVFAQSVISNEKL